MTLIKQVAAPLASFALALMLAPAASADDAAVRKEIIMWIKDADDKIVQLAEATPEAQVSWRPAKGVRSTGEVFMHVAAANFGLPAFSGVAPPKGFEFASFEKSATKKEDVVKQLKSSFAHLEKALEEASDETLNKEVDLFGHKTTSRSSYLLLLSHAHEHLGQSIAYARMNGIVPPWSRTAEQAPQKKSDAKTAENEKK
jgi:uncharacterized damage-inducible protein DinB